MTIRNWVELLILAVIIIAGIIIKRYTLGKVEDIDGLGAVCHKDQKRQVVTSIEEEEV